MPKLCVVGAGRWGMNHVRTLHQLGALGGVVETSRAAHASITEIAPGTPCFAELEPALDAGFDGFVVATPAQTHVAVAERIIARRRPLLVEKPLALSLHEARQLTERARAAGVNLMVGHVLLFHPSIRRIKALVRGGKIGRLQYLYSNRLNLGTVRTEENILWSFAPHDLSIFHDLIGEPPTEVVSRGGAFLQRDVHDTTLTVLTYPQQIVGHIFVSWLHPFKEHRLVLIGSEGMLSFEDEGDRAVCFYPKGIDWVEGRPVRRDGPTEIIACDPTPPLTEELRYFIDHLDGSPIEIAGPDSALAVLEILERASVSLRGG